MGTVFAYLILIGEIIFFIGFGLQCLIRSKRFSKKENPKRKIILLIAGIVLTGRGIILIYEFFMNWVF
jgi:hypothetical protein